AMLTQPRRRGMIQETRIDAPRICWRRPMNSVALPKMVTPEELLAMPNGDSYELVDGKLVEREMGAWSSYVGASLLWLLAQHCRQTGAGWFWGGDTGYLCFPARPTLVRKPDVSFIRVGR